MPAQQVTFVAKKTSPATNITMIGFLVQERTVAISKIYVNGVSDESGERAANPFSLGLPYSYTQIANYFLLDPNAAFTSIELITDNTTTNLESFATAGPIATIPPVTAANTDAIAVTVTLSEAVTGLVAGDFVLGNATVGTLTTANNIAFTLNVTPTAPGAVQITLPRGSCLGNTSKRLNRASKNF